MEVKYVTSCKWEHKSQREVNWAQTGGLKVTVGSFTEEQAFKETRR